MTLFVTTASRLFLPLRILFSLKAICLITLACLSLCLGSPQRTQAQEWIPVACDKDGNALTPDQINNFASTEPNDQINANGFLPLIDVSEKGGPDTNTNTYPMDSDDNPYDPLAMFHTGGTPWNPDDFPFTNDTVSYSYLTDWWDTP